MEQLDKLDRKLHRRKTNINYFVPLFEPEDEEGHKHTTKPNTPIMVPSEDGEGGEKSRTKKG